MSKLKVEDELRLFNVHKTGHCDEPWNLWQTGLIDGPDPQYNPSASVYALTEAGKVVLAYLQFSEVQS